VLFDFYNHRYGISRTAWRVMVRVGSDGPLSGREVGQLTTMDAVQVTRAINELAELGLVSRRTDPNDRRRIVLRLSAKGEAAYAAIVPKALDLEKWLLSGLTPSELKALRSASARLYKKVSKMVQ
jgi:DNA-binding MarR family transcriptional regulator